MSRSVAASVEPYGLRRRFLSRRSAGPEPKKAESGGEAEALPTSDRRERADKPAQPAC
ncbi:hypothetical protein AVDCRST_MAG82-998 [uncultured Rubrobacteraceae bacterium]|uniref:Uncharacterized protein n=1 Tax=uncultured Rubrobacteraceae bacterium TaxID=349277 RepID=A0A6J4PES2_9ACTN|nr:hypothetical protein AVDCRST_MAG82-998 [uncultured Rubrobacteraceae bacterium]